MGEDIKSCKREYMHAHGAEFGLKRKWLNKTERWEEAQPKRRETLK